METATIKQQLHLYVDKGDEKLLRLMNALAKEYSEDDSFEFEFTEDNIKLFDERRLNRLEVQANYINCLKRKSKFVKIFYHGNNHPHKYR